MGQPKRWELRKVRKDGTRDRCGKPAGRATTPDPGGAHRKREDISARKRLDGSHSEELKIRSCAAAPTASSSGSGRADWLHANERQDGGTAKSKTCCGIRGKPWSGFGRRRLRCRQRRSKWPGPVISEIRRVLPHHQRAAEVVGCTFDPMDFDTQGVFPASPGYFARYYVR